MENGSRQHRVRAAPADPVGQMFQRAHPAGGDHRDLHRPGNRPRQLQVITVLGSVPVHRGEQDLPRSPFLGLARPADRILPGRRPAAVNEDFPRPAAPLGVDRHYHALAAEPVRRLGDQPGALDRSRIQRDLVGAGGQDLPDLLDALDAATDRERNEDLLGDAGRKRNPRVPPLGRGGNVQEDQLIGALSFIPPGRLNRVPGVFEL